MENYQAVIRMQLIKSALFLVGVIVFVKCITTFVPEAVSVSSTINGRELPIYCVETQDKKVALSFDAAWGNEDTQKILDILARHNVHVTFFMTGGWVDAYPDDVFEGTVMQIRLGDASSSSGSSTSEHDRLMSPRVEQLPHRPLLVFIFRLR